MSTSNNFFKDENGDWSSKRLVGVGGMAVIFLCLAFCTVMSRDMPSVTEFLAGCCVALLGAETTKNTITGVARAMSSGNSEQSVDCESKE